MHEATDPSNKTQEEGHNELELALFNFLEMGKGCKNFYLILSKDIKLPRLVVFPFDAHAGNWMEQVDISLF